MNHQKRFLALVSALLLCLMFSSLAMGEEALPQLEPVAFPEGAGSPLPENPRENPVAPDSNYSADDLHYHDDTLDVRIHHIRVYDTPVAVAFVQIADASQLRTEQAKPYPSKTTMRVDSLTKRVHAVLSVNADWFTYHNSGIIYRNGKLLRDRPDEEYDGLVIDTSGDLHIVSPLTTEGFAALNVPIAQSFAFGPALVIGGEINHVDRVVTYKQRMAIGQVAPLSYVLIAADGPDQPNSVGLSIPQLSELMIGLGAHTAYNLDGGQSTSMLMHEIKINGQNPKTQRSVGDILYFVSAISH